MLSNPEPCDAVASNGFVKLDIIANAVLFLLSTNIMVMAEKPLGFVPSSKGLMDTIFPNGPENSVPTHP